MQNVNYFSFVKALHFLCRLGLYLTYQLVAYPIFILLPAVGVLVFCLLVAFTVKYRSRTIKLPTSQQQARLKKEKQAVVQLLLIIASFLIGYIPFIGKCSLFLKLKKQKTFITLQLSVAN